MMLGRRRRPVRARLPMQVRVDGSAQAATIRTRRGVFATPRCRISTRSTRSRAICCATPPMPTTPCRNAICARFRHFETFRGPAIRPWLLAILRNVCRAEFARRSAWWRPVWGRRWRRRRSPLWSEAPETPETADACASGTRSRSAGWWRAAGAVPRGDRAARDQRPVLSRDRRDRRRAGRHRDVAAGAGARDAARGLAQGRREEAPR